MQFVLLVGFGFAIKVPGHFGNGAALDGSWDPDRISGTNAQQVIRHDVDADGGRNCGVGNIVANISDRHRDTFREMM